MLDGPKLWVISPCFYDGLSFDLLRRRADVKLSKTFGSRCTFVLVDDSAGMDPSLRTIREIPNTKVITVPYNLGHQGAIVYALRTLAPKIADNDFVITMDSDGEDCPEHMGTLLSPLQRESDNLHLIALAQRTKRQESPLFKLFYGCFKVFFVACTGKVVRNGNFAALRGLVAKNLVFHPYFDYCYSSSLLALAQNPVGVPLPRGVRYQGQSKMTIVTLIAHGFRMLLPFSERIAIRCIISAAVIFAASTLMGAIAWCFLILGNQSWVSLSVWTSTLFTFATMLGLSACIFFQVHNQTRALMLSRFSNTNSRPNDSDFGLPTQAQALEQLYITQNL